MGPRVLGGYNVASRPLFTKNGGMRATDMEALKCGICFNVLRDPVQLITCGCRYCNTCVQALMDNQDRCVRNTQSDFIQSLYYLCLFSVSFNCPIEGEAFTRNDVSWL